MATTAIDRPERGDGGAMALARLILDYIRVLIWPTAVALVLFYYEADIRKLLTEREVEAFGFRVGPRIEEVGANFQAEIDEIRELLAQQRAAPGAQPEVTDEIATKVERLEENLYRDLRQIQQAAVPQTAQQQAAPAEQAAAPPTVAAPVPPPQQQRTAGDWERIGFEAVAERDIDRAIQAFTAAFNLWPDYHNVDEIRRLLIRWRDRLQDSNAPAWAELYDVLVTQYSWGMPADVRTTLRAQKG